MARLKPNFETQFVEVVERIYEASNEGAWPGAIEGICDFVGARAADMNSFDPASRQVIRFVPVRTDEFVQRYVAEFMSDLMNTNPRMPMYMGMNQGDCIADSDVWSEQDMGKMPFFADLMRPWGTFDTLNTAVRKTDDGRPWIGLTVHFGVGARPPPAEARERLRMVLPHLRRACSVEERLQLAQQENAVLGEALEHVAEPVALLSASARVVRANKAASDLLRGGGLPSHMTSG